MDNVTLPSGTQSLAFGEYFDQSLDHASLQMNSAELLTPWSLKMAALYDTVEFTSMNLHKSVLFLKYYEFRVLRFCVKLRIVP